MPQFSRLNAGAVLATVTRLESRIAARFPDRNLRKVAATLRTEVERIASRPHRTRTERAIAVACWVAIAVIAALAAVGIGVALVDSLGPAGTLRGFEWVQFAESAINDVVFAGLAIFFLRALPSTIRRRTELSTLHRLRSIAHVIDMHQLTKDPERLADGFQPTSETVQVGLTSGELANYLDYCSEMLSLVGKAAALYAEGTSDQAILSTVSDIEDLTTGMSRKIWQKVALLPRG